MFIQTVIKALDKAKIRHVLVGGYAVALHGAVRGTVDLDYVIAFELAQFEGVERALANIGLTPRLPVTATEVYQFREEYIDKRNLVAWSFIDFMAHHKKGGLARFMARLKHKVPAPPKTVPTFAAVLKVQDQALQEAFGMDWTAFQTAWSDFARA